MTAQRTKAEIAEEIRNLEAIEVHIETNQGTYGGVEAARKVGSGSPEFANREVYETVGGRVRSTGPDEDVAPGRMRQIGRDTLADYRKRVAKLREEMKRAK